MPGGGEKTYSRNQVIFIVILFTGMGVLAGGGGGYLLGKPSLVTSTLTPVASEHHLHEDIQHLPLQNQPCPPPRPCPPPGPIPRNCIDDSVKILLGIIKDLIPCQGQVLVPLPKQQETTTAKVDVSTPTTAAATTVTPQTAVTSATNGTKPTTPPIVKGTTPTPPAPGKNKMTG